MRAFLKKYWTDHEKCANICFLLDGISKFGFKIQLKFSLDVAEWLCETFQWQKISEHYFFLFLIAINLA